MQLTGPYRNDSTEILLRQSFELNNREHISGGGVNNLAPLQRPNSLITAAGHVVRERA